MQSDLFELQNQYEASLKKQVIHALGDYRLSLRLDQALISLILLLMLFAVIFSWGVEAGKRQVAPIGATLKDQAVVLPQSTAVDSNRPDEKALPVTDSVLTARILGAAAAPPSQEIHAAVAKGQEVPTTPYTELSGDYTIQSVTYKSERAAMRQIRILKKQGLHGFIIPSGSYYQVCVNAFATKALAQETLARLKPREIVPPDAYVRMIKR